MPDFHVTKTHDSDEWRVLQENHSNPVATAPTQEEAEKIAKDFAEQAGGGEVVVHTSDRQDSRQ
jgi:hypothetical protein